MSSFSFVRSPTTSQSLWLPQEIAVRIAGGGAVGCQSVHDVPFQVSRPIVKLDVPIATQWRALVHDTSFNSLTTAPAAFGVVRWIHAWPFHRPASVASLASVRTSPT